MILLDFICENMSIIKRTNENIVANDRVTNSLKKSENILDIFSILYREIEIKQRDNPLAKFIIPIEVRNRFLIDIPSLR